MLSPAFSAGGREDQGETQDHGSFGCAAAGMRWDLGWVRAPEIPGYRTGPGSATLAQLPAFCSSACWIRFLGCSEERFNSPRMKFHFNPSVENEH